MLGRYWEMVERLKVTQFYTAPTALRLLLKSGNDYVKKYDRSSIRLLGCGEYTDYRQRPCSSSLSQLVSHSMTRHGSGTTMWWVREGVLW